MNDRLFKELNMHHIFSVECCRSCENGIHEGEMYFFRNGTYQLLSLHELLLKSLSTELGVSINF